MNDEKIMPNQQFPYEETLKYILPNMVKQSIKVKFKKKK